MRRYSQLLLLSCLLLFQSCFEIIEQVTVKNDGSGNFQLVINMSKSKTKLNSIMKMKKVNGHDVPSTADITNKIAAIETAVKTTTGISNVKTSLDFDNYIASISCNFLKVNNLNMAVQAVSDKENSKKPIIDDMFKYDENNKVFSQLNKFILKDEYKKMSNADKEIFTTANYTAIFRFENEVLTSANKESKISANKKAVMTKLNVLDLITNKKSIENNINLKK